MVSQACEKGFYVSPFMDMDHRLRLPPDRAGRPVHAGHEGGSATKTVCALNAGFPAERQGVQRPRSCSGPGCAHPLLTLKVVGGIHFEALKVWLKGILGSALGAKATQGA